MNPIVPPTIGNYVLKRQIGKGSFATVWRAEHKLAKKAVAIKVIQNTSIATQDAKTRFLREVNLIKQMDHPFISKLFEVIETQSQTFLVMEYAENGSILTYVNTHGRLPEKQARRYFSQLISALEYIHFEKKVAHRDLKAENILLDRNNNIRLIDFGLSNTFSEDSPDLTTACGSPAYASPEMVRGNPYTKATDVWSSGILLYAICIGQLPFEDENMQRLLQKIAFTEPVYPSYLSPQLVDLLHKILTKTPESRISLEKIKHHPWFSQSEYQNILKLNFSSDDQWLVGGIDREIVQTIASYGLDVKGLPQAIMSGEYNATTAVYRLLRRDKITDHIKDMMDDLNNPNGKVCKEASGNQSARSPEAASAPKGMRQPSPKAIPRPIPRAVVPGLPAPSSKSPKQVAKENRNSMPIPNPPKTTLRASQPSPTTSDSAHASPRKSAEEPMAKARTSKLGAPVKRGRVNSLVIKGNQ